MEKFHSIKVQELRNLIRKLVKEEYDKQQEKEEELKEDDSVGDEDGYLTLVSSTPQQN